VPTLFSMAEGNTGRWNAVRVNKNETHGMKV
jgi:hypothetical protein